MRLINEVMLKMNKGTKFVDMSTSLTTDVEDMEFKVDSLGIKTTDHVDPSNVSHVTRKDTDMQTVHTTTKLT